MDKFILDLVLNAGPPVVIVLLFLFWDLKKDSNRRIEREELNRRLLKAIDDNTKSNSELSVILQTRPCLWEKETQEFVSKMSNVMEVAVDRIVEGIYNKNGEYIDGDKRIS